MLKGKRIPVSANRLFYFLNYEQKILIPDNHISHLCHVKGSLNIDYL